MTQYKGSCHCGNVSFDVEMDLKSVIDCNCSICRRKGWLLAFTPAENFHLRSGSDSLSDYQFNKKHIHHTFCTKCGVGAFSNGSGPDGKVQYAINVRCLDGVDLSSLEVIPWDGASA